MRKGAATNTRNAFAIIGIIGIGAIFLGACSSTVPTGSGTIPSSDIANNHCKWLERCREDTEKITVGSTRAELMTVYSTSAGFSTALSGRYATTALPVRKAKRPHVGADTCRVHLVVSPTLEAGAAHVDAASLLVDDDSDDDIVGEAEPPALLTRFDATCIDIGGNDGSSPASM